MPVNDQTPPPDAPRRTRGSRAHGRELALLALCHLESYRPDERSDALEIFWTHAPSEAGDAGADLRAWLADPEAVAFARLLLAPILARGPELDAILEATSRSWRLSRMDRVDRNVLRLVAAELSPRPSGPEARPSGPEARPSALEARPSAPEARPSAPEARPSAPEATDLSETPRGVILAEAVRLASRYGSERSAAFVNGVAEALARRLRPS